LRPRNSMMSALLQIRILDELFPPDQDY
jgi:hypothetical protein